MYPEFQKWGSAGPWFLEMGPMLQNVGSMIFISFHFLKSRINQTLNMGAFGHRQLQKLGAHTIFCRKVARPRSECIPEVPLYYTRSRITRTRLYRIIAYFEGHLPHQKSLHLLNVKKFCYIELK